MSGISPEAVAVTGTGIALAELIMPSLRELRHDTWATHERHMGDVRERLARLEGMFDVFARREPEVMDS